MTLRKIVGYALIASPFVVIFIIGCTAVGIVPMLAILGLAGFMVGAIATGVWIIERR